MFLSELDFQLCNAFDTDRLMPPEILSKVLRHLCSDGPLPLRHVLFVSKRFYNAAVNDAFLWTTISFDAVFFSYFRGRSIKQTNNFTKQCLLRSSALPLRLCIHTEQFGSTYLQGALRILRNPKYKGFERCTSLLWSNEFPDLVERIVALLPVELPSLQHLSLYQFNYHKCISKFPNCPLLRRVELFQCLLDSPNPWAETFAHVTTLSIGMSSFSAYYALAVSPRLHELTICAGDTEYLAPPTVRIRLGYLQILKVRGDVPENMLLAFLAPALKELHIEANYSGNTAMDAPWDRFELRCLRLYVILPETVRAKEPLWVASLSWVVRQCTRLKTVYISKWMEEECKYFMVGLIDVSGPNT